MHRDWSKPIMDILFPTFPISLQHGSILATQIPTEGISGKVFSPLGKADTVGSTPSSFSRHQMWT